MEEKKTTTYIGGQAVIEGVMMRGKTMYAMAVRNGEGEIVLEKTKLNTGRTGIRTENTWI